MTPMSLTARRFLLVALTLLIPAVAGASPALPADFPLSPVTWGGLGGANHSDACPTLTHHPVILVHDHHEGPEVWWEGHGEGPAGALARAGFGSCEIWAIRAGQAGQPQRSLEELTDDLAFFVGSVMAYTGAPKVQLLARGDGAVLAHTTLAKYRLHGQVHAAVYLDAPFQGVSGCGDDACFSGDIRCCSLQPGSLMLRRALLPLEAPLAQHWDSDLGPTGHLLYLALGSSPATPLLERTPQQGGWMLDGAANLSFPALASQPLHQVEPAWEVVLEALSDPAEACDASHDQDGDGFCDGERGGADCDDADPGVHPGAEEIEADGIDQNCNGHDVDRRFPGWACERPLDQAAPAPPAPPVLEPTQPEPDHAWLWVSGLLALVLMGGGLLALRSGRRHGSSGAGLTLLALLVPVGEPQAQGVQRLPDLPAELRLGVLLEAADGDMDAALERCHRGDHALEPMPDRHPHAEPPGAHFRDLGFHAPDELDEPLRSALRTMEVQRQGCAKVQTSAGPVILVRFEGAPAAPWSPAQQQAWAQRQDRLAGAAALLQADLPTAAATRGFADDHLGAGSPEVATRPVPPWVVWVGDTEHATRRPVQLEAAAADPRPVSAGAFRRFTTATGYTADPRSLGLPPDAPVAYVDLADAWAYCAWVGGELPAVALLEALALPQPATLEWTTSAQDGESVMVAGAQGPRARSWQTRGGTLGFRCSYAR